MSMRTLLPACLLGLVLANATQAANPIKVLFLGDNGHHRPAERYRQLAPVLARRGIDVVYTDKVSALNDRLLASYDALIVYANIDHLPAEQEKALLAFVENGKGFIPLHCASYCFRNSRAYIDLVGAQFLRHGTGTVRTEIARPDHPIMKGFKGFESWDETYVHTKHNEKDRIVLEYRPEGRGKEPWTWVRTQGKGRIFYTAWGHDARTWGNPGFQALVERGIRWAVGQDPSVVPAPSKDAPTMIPLPKNLKPFEYVEARIPYYPPSAQWGRTGEPLRKMQKPLPPAESMKHIVHPDDFELKLFVAEDKLGGKPICMAWDERGRLWVALTVDYPNEIKPQGQGRDRIVLCEDSDGDGVADKVTEFADKLSIPTSIAFANGGVVVLQAPHTLFLQDTDGDGKADVRKILFTGWSTSDTHAGPSNLQYGLDNWLYGILGYAGFRGRVGNESHNFRTGFWRMTPDGKKLEFLRNTNNNSWGLGFSEEGILFGSTANGNPSVYMPIPNRYYEAVRGWSSRVLGGIAGNARIYPITDKVRQVDHHGRFTAGAGHALYTARAYPREYWNRTAFVAEPTGHLLATFVLQPEGADFVSRNAWNLLASDDEWVAPIMAEVGPDGCVWVIDWYNFIVQHNPTPPGFRTGRGGAYETEHRDKKHGRIYRLVPKNGKKVEAFTLKDATAQKLVQTLKNDNLFWRRHAQRLLVERGQKDVVPALLEVVKDSRVDEIGLNVGAIHALWTLHGLGALDGTDAKSLEAAAGALKHRSAGVRRNAALVLPRTAAGLKALLAAKLTEDEDAQVRLATLLTLAEMPASVDAARAIARALSRPENAEDRWIPDAATSAAATNALEFLKSVSADNGKLNPATRRILGIVAEHYARGGPSDSVGTLLAALKDAPLEKVEAVLAGLARGWPEGKPARLDDAGEKALVQLLARLSASARGNLARLASSWGSKALEKHAASIARTLLETLADAKQSDQARINAARQLLEMQPVSDEIAEKILEAITARNSASLNEGLLETLLLSRSKKIGSGVLARLDGWPPSSRKAALRLLMGRVEAIPALIGALEQGTIKLGELTLDQKIALQNHPDRDVAARVKKLLERGGELPSPDREKVVRDLMPVVRKKGDATAGLAVFKKHCATCHTHSGEGGKVGPDLTGMAVHPKEHLLTEILDPSRSVEGNYKAYTVETRRGRLYTGLLASETRTSLELVDAEAKKQVILKENVARLTASPKSLMPEGFEKQISEKELADLLEFLTKRGKYLALPLGKAATAVSTRGMFYDEESQVERLVFDDWGLKTFDGVPFVLIDPQGGRVPNVILLHSRLGRLPPRMPKSVSVPAGGPAKAIHFLSGVSGWGYPYDRNETTSMIVRLHYADGKKEDHPLKNGVHFADYIRKVEVPGSKYAFNLNGRQIRYLKITPNRSDPIATIELVKGDDATAPVVMAVTVEAPE